MAKIYVLLSGGIDSLVCAHMAARNGKDTTGVFVDYHQAARDPERRAVMAIAEHLDIPLISYSIDFGRSFGEGEVLGRNLLLLSACLSGIDDETGAISIGVHAGTDYHDCGPEFIFAANTLIQNLSGGRFVLMAPLIEWTKQQVIGYVIEEGLPLHLSYSCERGVLPPCGECLSCRDREGILC